MPKFFLLFLLLTTLILSGCATRANSLMLNEKTAPKSMESFNDQEIKQRIIDLKNGLKPKVSPSKKPTPPLGKPIKP
jgi:hypothetical protein